MLTGASPQDAPGVAFACGDRKSAPHALVARADLRDVPFVTLDPPSIERGVAAIAAALGELRDEVVAPRAAAAGGRR